MTDALIISSDNFATFVGRMSPLLDERERRLFAGSLANMLGRGGLKRVSELTGMSRVTGRKAKISLAIPSFIEKVLKRSL